MDTTQSPDDDSMSEKYKRLGGKSLTTTSDLIDLVDGDSQDVKIGDDQDVKVGDSQDVKINLKVRSVQINRPWIDFSALNIHNWRIPGVESGAWSTGVLDSSNNGSFPLLSTQMIIAKDITITGTKFSQELHSVKSRIVDHINPPVNDAILVSKIFIIIISWGYNFCRVVYSMLVGQMISSMILNLTQLYWMVLK